MEEKQKKKQYKVNAKSKKIIIISIICLVIIVGVVIYVLNNTSQRVVGEKTKEFVEALAAEEYYLKLDILDNDLEPMQSSIEITRDGDDMYMTVGNEAILIKDGYFYSIDKTSKTAYRVKADSPLAKIKLKNTPKIAVQSLLDTGREEFADKEYDYEQYGECKIYTDNGKVVYLVAGKTNIKIQKFDAKVNKKLLDFPEDYQYQEIDI